MKRLSFVLPMIAVATLAACDREPTAPRDVASPVAVAPRPAASPAPAASAAAPDAATARFDTGAYSGTFAAGRTRLELHGEGTYGLDDAGVASSGTWTRAPDGTLRLDPGTKDAEDRVYRMDGADALVRLDANGQPASTAPLKRLPTP